MDNRTTNAMLVLVVLLSAGCLGAVEEIIEDIDQTIDALEGDYPQLEMPERTRSSPALHSYDACEALLEDLQRAVYEEMLVSLDQESYWHWVTEPWRTGIWVEDIAFDGGVPVAEMAADDSAASQSGSEAPSSREGEFSGTNNQEAGVDEADFLKTDGYHIYMLNGQLLLIMGVPEFGNLTLESNLTIEGNPTQMMIDGDRLVIASSIYYWSLRDDSELRNVMAEEVTVTSEKGEEDYSYTYMRVQNLVKYTVVDITDRTAPR